MSWTINQKNRKSVCLSANNWFEATGTLRLQTNPKFAPVCSKNSQSQNGWKEMEIHVKARQNLYRDLCALSLNSVNTAVLLSFCANSGDTGFKNRVFLQAR